MLARINLLKEKIAESRYLATYPAKKISELRRLSSQTAQKTLELEIDRFLKDNDKIFTDIYAKILSAETANYKKNSDKTIKKALTVLLQINTEFALQIIIDAVQKSYPITYVYPPIPEVIINLLGTITSSQKSTQKSVLKIFENLLTIKKAAFRINIIHTLIKYNIEGRLELLIESLNTKISSERRIIKEFFLTLPSEPRISTLIEKRQLEFNEKALDVALDIAIHNDQERAKKQFKSFITSKRIEKRLVAIIGYSKIDTPETKHVLLEVLNRDKMMALAAIQRIPSVFGKESSHHLIPLLAGGDHVVQIEVLRALKQVKNERDFDTIAELLENSTDQLICIHAIKVLEEINIEKLLPLLYELVKNPIHERIVRWEVLEILEIAGKVSLPLLLAFLEDTDSSLRAKTVQIIAEIDTPGHSRVFKKILLNDQNYIVRSEALASLALIENDEEALNAIEKIVDIKDRDLRLQAATILLKKGKRELISKRLPLLNPGSNFSYEIARSKMSDLFFLHLIELSHYCGLNRFKFDYQNGIFRGYYLSGSQELVKISYFTIDPVANKLEMEELLDLEDAIGRIIYIFDFDNAADNIRSKLTVKEFRVEENSAVCKIYIPASVKANTVEMARHGKGHVMLAQSLQFNQYERVRLLIEEFSSNGHASAAIKGKLYIAALENNDNVKMVKMLFPLAIDCLAWYCYHYFLTRDVPSELELDSLRELLSLLYDLRYKYDLTPLIARTIEVIHEKYSFSDTTLKEVIFKFLESEMEMIEALKKKKEQQI
jgi:HEAT repeat protein